MPSMSSVPTGPPAFVPAAGDRRGFPLIWIYEPRRRGAGMGWEELRERLIFMAMSAFVVWHVMAIMIAPASDNSALAQSLRRVFDPYLTLFRLNSKWDFYAPNVGRGHQLRYIVEGADGDRRTFTSTDGWSWHHPAYWSVSGVERRDHRVSRPLCRPRHRIALPPACRFAADRDHAPAHPAAGLHAGGSSRRRPSPGCGVCR